MRHKSLFLAARRGLFLIFLLWEFLILGSGVYGAPLGCNIRVDHAKSCSGYEKSGAQLPAYLQDTRMMRKTHLSAYLRIHGDS